MRSPSNGNLSACLLGCDASILIDSTEGSKSEKDAKDSFFLWGFNFIDDVKEILEVECPSIVSCADIIARTVRDVVALVGGPKYKVPTGGRDGLVSNIDEVDGMSFGFDNSFYKQLLLGKGILKLDQCLVFDNSMRALVYKYAVNNEVFLQSFAKAIVKMGSISVLTGDEGEIRKNCRAFNHPR
ncbi:peroxidase 57-like [Prosopis cineraria]|uniref:peroxidase 57-like n=1 Tax=Prosopis cineraria TaxID=364024 RepID=UPI00240F98B6|nr:peroxidase 57-like [Prosopis cineraria]